MNIIETIISGLILTFILFFINEVCFPKKNLSGEWEAILNIVKTSYDNYKNLKLVYKIHLIQKGYELSGSGEKIKEIFPDDNETEFAIEKRIVINIEGYYQRNYIRKSIIILNIKELGRRRETRATYILYYKSKGLIGTFVSTAANESGNIIMKKIII